MDHIKKSEKLKEKEIIKEREKLLWNMVKYSLNFYNNIRKWEKNHQICTIALPFFTELSIKEKIKTFQAEYKKKYQGWNKLINLKAKRLYSKAKQFEKNKNYRRAVDIYHRIIKNSYLKETKIAQNIKIPILIETNPPSIRCYVDKKFVGVTPLVHRHHPGKIPHIVVICEGFEEAERKVYKTYARNIWKISIRLE